MHLIQVPYKFILYGTLYKPIIEGTLDMYLILGII